MLAHSKSCSLLWCLKIAITGSIVTTFIANISTENSIYIAPNLMLDICSRWKISLRHSHDSAELKQHLCYFFFYETAYQNNDIQAYLDKCRNSFFGCWCGWLIACIWVMYLWNCLWREQLSVGCWWMSRSWTLS